MERSKLSKVTLADLQQAAAVVEYVANVSGVSELTRLAGWMQRYVELTELVMSAPTEDTDRILAGLAAKKGRA